MLDLPPSCTTCEDLRPAIRSVRSTYLLAEPVRSVVHALKYGGWFSLARPMAKRMASVEWPDEVREEVGLVTAVPTSRMKERQRGYNQAALLAAETAALLRRDADCNLLERIRSAGSQTTLHPGERRANVAGAFRLAPGRGHRVAGVHVLLVDDVWTTGATALSCADTLLAAGARAVSVLTFARALPDLERHEQRLEAAATFRRRKN
ncbi:MAG: ComF family protein [Gemmatimonas sp.]|nr:ComF family protein [Gemmatimonas sp.]